MPDAQNMERLASVKPESVERMEKAEAEKNEGDEIERMKAEKEKMNALI